MKSKQENNNALIRFICYSLFGIFMFFVPIDIMGKKLYQ